MGFRINTNVASIAAQRSLSQNTNQQTSTFAKLSSGSRINKAADDAAGLAMSEKLKARIRGTKQAERNANDGISLVQTAEGALSEISNLLVRLRELSVQASSDTISNDERKFTNLEYQNLKEEIERISQVTEFNNKKLLNGEGNKYDFQIGLYNDDFEDRIKYDAVFLNSTLSNLFGGKDAIQKQLDLREKLKDIEYSDDFDNEIERIKAREELQESYVKSLTEGSNNRVAELNVKTKDFAQLSLKNLDSAIQKVSNQRAELGAIQNRLTSVINNLQVNHENLSATNSRIRDTDYASEAANGAKLSILQNMGTSVLSQANSNPQLALKLIG
jgi:flagellin